jgi:hypothetical protein
MKFDWQTDEDGLLVPESVESRRDSAPRYRWLIWLGISAVLLLTGLAVYYQLNRRVDAAHAEIEADVLAAFNLAQQALAQGDAELLATILYREDSQWAREWEGVAQEGRYPPHIPPLLMPDGAAEVTAVRFTTELDEAEITWRRPYALQSGDHNGQIIYLQHTDFYRKTPVGWRWTPPPDDFTGEWLTESGDYLSLIYPARDAETALRLAASLDASLQSWCEGDLPAQLSCPTRPPWNLHLNRSPATLNRVDQLHDSLRIPPPPPPGSSATGFSLPALPAIWLLGEPLDEAGHEALRRHFTLQLAVALIRHNQAGTATPPGRVETVAWLEAIGVTLPPPADPSTAPPSLAAANGLVTLCYGAGGGRYLWQYEAVGDDWQAQLPSQQFYEAMPWPGGGLFLGSREETGDGLEVTFSRYVDGRLLPIHRFQPRATQRGQPYEFGGLFPAGLFGMFYSIMLNIVDGDDWRMYQVDEAACDESGCALINLSDGTLPRFWSPDGRHLLLYPDEETLELRDQANNLLRTFTRQGDEMAQWLDNERFIFLSLNMTQSGPADMRITVAHVTGGKPDWIIDPVAALAARLPEPPANVWLMPFHHLPESDRLIMIGEWSSPGVADTTFGFALLQLDETQPILTPLPINRETLDNIWRFPTVSPDNRWLVMSGANGSQFFTELVDLDRIERQRVSLPVARDLISELWLWEVFSRSNAPLIWSPDGRWLVLDHHGAFYLLDPAENELTALMSPQPGCVSAAWLDP